MSPTDRIHDVQIAIRISRQLHEALKAEASKHSMSLAELIRFVLTNYKLGAWHKPAGRPKASRAKSKRGRDRHDKP